MSETQQDQSQVIRRATPRAGLILLAVIACGLLAVVAISASDNRASSRDAPLNGLAHLDAVEYKSASPLITPAEISAAASSPAATALLRWWQAIQFDVPMTELYRYYAPSSGASTRSLASDLALARYGFQTAKPVVLSEIDSGAAATLLALVGRGSHSQMISSIGVSVIPYEFRLKQVGGRWLLSDNAYMNQQARAVRAYELRHRRPKST
jgi:hypothetical protein